MNLNYYIVLIKLNFTFILFIGVLNRKINSMWAFKDENCTRSIGNRFLMFLLTQQILKATTAVFLLDYLLDRTVQVGTI